MGKSIHELLGLKEAVKKTGAEKQAEIGAGPGAQNLAKCIPDYQINLVNAADPGI